MRSWAGGRFDNLRRGAAASYLRIPFELAGESTPRRLTDPQGVSWKVADDNEELIAVLAEALETLLDPRERALVTKLGARQLRQG